MENIFKYNLEPNINYENINFNQVKEILKNLRLNISDEIKCITFIKNKLKKENINLDENSEINETLLKKYCLILDKLNELCLEEINYISETIIILDSRIKETNDKTNLDPQKEDIIYDKIDLTISNYNKIIDNINKTISSLPYIFNLYLLYNKIEDEENKYIRDNIEKEEIIYKQEHKDINKNKKIERLKHEEEKEITKREKMIKFDENLKNLNTEKNIRIKNININEGDKVKPNNEINKENLRKMIKELNSKKEELKNFIFKYCVKENEIKNFNKIKEENKMLSEEIINIKNSLKELNEIYESQLEKLEYLKNERSILKKENLQLCDYINKKLDQNINDNNIYEKNYNNKDFKTMEINQNIKFNSKDESDFNISPIDFESIEMFKRLNKL
jgi:hypothetical protein